MRFSLWGPDERGLRWTSAGALLAKHSSSSVFPRACLGRASFLPCPPESWEIKDANEQLGPCHVCSVNCQSQIQESSPQGRITTTQRPNLYFVIPPGGLRMDSSWSERQTQRTEDDGRVTSRVRWPVVSFSSLSVYLDTVQIWKIVSWQQSFQFQAHNRA